MKELTQAIENLLTIVNRFCPFSEDLQVAVDRLRDAVVRLKDPKEAA